MFTCDGCDRRYQAHTTDPTTARVELAEHGWRLGHREDFCPGCGPAEVWVKGEPHRRQAAPEPSLWSP